MNSKNSKNSDPHRLTLSLTGNIDLNRSDKYNGLSNRSIYCTWKNVKSHTKTINLKYLLSHGTTGLNNLIDEALYLIFKVILSKSWKTENSDCHPPKRKYVNKTEINYMQN